MKPSTIFSGKITAKGNLTGYNAAGARIHISAQQLASAGINPAAITFPLYALTVTRTFDKRDDNDQPILDTTGKPETFEREQAGSIFTTKEAMIEAINSDKLISIEAASALNTAAVASGLTADSITALMESTLFN